MRREWILCCLLAGLTVGVYWPARQLGYVDYDDDGFVTRNPYVQAGLTPQSIRYALTAIVVENWHPVTVLSHMLDCELFGVHPGPQHLVNVAFHTANTLLLFLLLRRMTGAKWRSAIVAAIFALHPLRVESVAWISERKDVLSAFFFLLTLWAYTRYAEVQSLGSGDGTDGKGDGTDETASSKPRPAPRTTPPSSLLHPPSSIFYLLSVSFFALGLMSKPMLVTLPFVILLLDYWPLDRLGSESHRVGVKNLLSRVGEKWCFFALSAVFCVITLRVEGSRGGVEPLSQVSLGDRVANAIGGYLEYLSKTVWPTNLAVLYPHPGLHYPVSDPWPAWQVGAIALLLLAISAFCICQLRPRPFLAVGWFWYLGTLVPVIGLIQVGGRAFADRYTYIPLIGPTIILVWLLAELWRRGAGWKLSLSAGTALALAACVILTRRQLGYWQNSITLFEHTLAVTPDNPNAQLNLGYALYLAGQPAQAAVRFRAALAIKPRFAEAHYDLATILKDRQLWPAAAEHFLAVVRQNPGDFMAHLALAQTLPHLGRTKDAAFHLDQFLRTCPRENFEPPDNPSRVQAAASLNDLAWLLATSERAENRDGGRAVRFAEQACDLTGYSVTIMVGTLAAAYAEAGRFSDAVATAEKACALAEQNSQPALLEKNRELLQLYRAGKPYREPTASAQSRPTSATP